MFCRRSVNTKFNKLRERSLRVIPDYSNSKFEDVLTKASSSIIHHQNIQTLEIEMFKNQQGFSQISFQDWNDFYSLRSQRDFQIPRISTAMKGENSIGYLGPLIWNIVPIEIRGIKNFDTFKTKKLTIEAKKLMVEFKN